MKRNFRYKKIIVLVLLFSLIAPTAFLALPQKASAFDFDDFANILTSGFEAISAGAASIAASALAFLALKEGVFDGIVPIIREIIIKSITRSIVNWINNGFEGGPSFITNLDSFLLNIADEVAGRFIEGSELAFLCSPFRLDVRIALALDYYAPFRDRVACTLTGSLENIENAFDDARNNSWNTWFELSLNPVNNPLWALTEAQAGLYASIRDTQGREIIKVDWGDGFGPFEICDTVKEGDVVYDDEGYIEGTIVGTKYNCQTATPGVVISEGLSNIIWSGFRQLELADEINEIISALLIQLITQTLGGSPGGLSGLSRSSFGESSYLDRLVEERADTSRVSGRILDTIRTDLQNESKYRNAKQTSLDSVRSARKKVELLRQCYLEKAAKNQILFGIAGEGSDKKLVSFTTAELTSLANSATTTINNTLLPLQTRLEKDIENVDTTIGQLVAIRTTIENTQTVNDLNDALEKYQALQQSGELRDIKEVFEAELERDGFAGEAPGLARGIVRDMAELGKKTDADLETCISLSTTQGSLSN